MDFELEPMPEPPARAVLPSPASIAPLCLESVPLCLESVPPAPPGPPASLGPAPIAPSLVAYRRHRQLADEGARLAMLVRRRSLLRRMRVLGWLAQVLVFLAVLGGLLAIDGRWLGQGILLTLLGGAWAVPMWLWRLWLMAPAADLAGIPVEGRLTPEGQVGTADSLLADARHKRAVQVENDASDELQFRWRCAKIQGLAALVGIGAMVPTMFVILSASLYGMLIRYHGAAPLGLVLACSSWGVLGFSCIGWLAVQRGWGSLSCMLICVLVAPLLSMLVTTLALPGALGFSLLVFLFTVMLVLVGGWLLGLMAEQIDRNAVHRIS